MRSVLQTFSLSAALALWAAFAFAQETAPGRAAPAANAPAGATATGSDWPCEQVQRPEISAGSIWHGSDPEAAVAATWRDDPAVATLVGQIAPRRTPQEQAIEAVHRFAAGYEQDRNKALTALFAGLFETLSHERSEIIRGIKHFNKRQDSLSQRIQEGWKRMDALDPSSTDPTIIEQRLFALARAIQEDLK